MAARLRSLAGANPAPPERMMDISSSSLCPTAQRDRLWRQHEFERLRDGKRRSTFGERVDLAAP
jgi:hypothetical protein